MTPPQQVIPYGHQTISETDIEAVVQVLRSDWLTCGPFVDAFEQALCAYTGSAHAVAVSNGTAALHLALKAAGIGPGDRVITSANTFLASANAAEMNGAIADFADISPESLCMTPETLERAWKPDVKAVVAVDFAGYPCATQALADFVHAKGAILIEDACHAVGGHLAEHRIGALPWVDLTTFSFHPVKTITTAEGGAILTNDPQWAAACRKLRSHGMQAESPDDIPRPYSMPEIGYNYRICDLQCALGISQLAQLDAFVERRRRICQIYTETLSTMTEIPISPALPYPGSGVAWHLYATRVRENIDRDQLRQILLKKGIGTQIHYYPVHLQPYYAHKYGYQPGKCPEAEKWYRQALSLPIFPSLQDQQIAFILEQIRELVPN